MNSPANDKRMRVPTSLLRLAVTALAVSAPLAVAQTSVTLSVQLYSGLSITGQVDQLYYIEYATSLAEPTTWLPLDLLLLRRSPSLYVDTTVSSAWSQRFYRARAPSLLPVPDMVPIPPGTFTMGSPESEAERCGCETQHEVTLTREFWMGKHEVTQGEYLEVMGSNPSVFRNGTASFYGGSGAIVTDESRHPVENVSWDQATNYCSYLTQRELAAGRISGRWRYRLPTEAEWEYACRGGTTSAVHYGPALRQGMANFQAGAEYDSTNGTQFVFTNTHLGRTTVVESYSPNAFGLYDMHGNVSEWCSDSFGSYPAFPVTDPKGPTTGSARVMRGGGWRDFGKFCRSAYRSSCPHCSSYLLGFRVVLALGQ